MDKLKNKTPDFLGSKTSENKQKTYYEKWKHHNIKHLIRANYKFIIHINKENKVDWETCETEYEPELLNYTKEEKKNHYSLLSRTDILDATPLEGIDPEIIHNYKTLIATSVLNILEKQYEEADNLLKLAEDYINKKFSDRSRNWLISTSFTTTFSYLLFGIFVFITQENWIRIFGLSFIDCYYSSIAGALGAFTSLILRLSRTDIDPFSSKILHEIESNCRIFIGIISGLITYLALNSGLLLASLIETQYKFGLILIASFSSGISERFIKSVIETIKS